MGPKIGILFKIGIKYEAMVNAEDATKVQNKDRELLSYVGSLFEVVSSVIRSSSLLNVVL